MSPLSPHPPTKDENPAVKLEIELAHFCRGYFVFSCLLGTLLLALFFAHLNMGDSDNAWGDVAYMNQLFHNAVNGRPLQQSIVHYWIHEDWERQRIINRFPYTNQWALHFNLLPYALAPLYSMWPTPNGLYTIVIGINIVGAVLFASVAFSGANLGVAAGTRAFLVVGILFSGPFLRVVSCHCLFSLFSGPLILASCYWLSRGAYGAHVIANVLLCTVSEDIALFVISLSAYGYCFHRDSRLASVLSMSFAMCFVLAVCMVIQPAAKLELLGDQAGGVSLLVFRMAALLQGVYSFCWRDLMVPLALLVGGSAVICVLLPRRDHFDVSRFLGLVLVAPSSHWLIVAVNGGGQHLMPIVAMTLVGLSYLAACSGRDRPTVSGRESVVVCAVTVLILVNFGVRTYRPAFVDLIVKGHLIAPSDAMLRNREVIEAVARIPATCGVCYWTNRNVEAFIANRSDLWRFPFFYDRADYLVLQRSATSGFFQAPVAGLLPDESWITGNWRSSGDATRVPDAAIEAIVANLVQVRRTHCQWYSSHGLVVLKRFDRVVFPVPLSSVGFGFLKDVPKVVASLSTRFSGFTGN